MMLTCTFMESMCFYQGILPQTLTIDRQYSGTQERSINNKWFDCTTWRKRASEADECTVPSVCEHQSAYMLTLDLYP